MDNHLSNSIEIYLGLLLEAGCKILFRTEFVGKPYVWMKDSNGVIFLERLPDEAEEELIELNPEDIQRVL